MICEFRTREFIRYQGVGSMYGYRVPVCVYVTGQPEFILFLFITQTDSIRRALMIPHHGGER